MKKISFVMLLAAIAASSKAQEMYNGGIVSIGSNTAVLVNGNLTNSSGSITNNGSLTVTGHLTNNAAFTTSGGGNLNLHGTITQILSGTSPLIAKNVSFNNAAGVKLATPLYIDGAATFISGVINATDSRYPVVFTANGSVSGAPTDASHVNGYVRKEGTGPFTYPLGNATTYQPVGVNLTANTAGLTALYVPADAGNAPYGTGGTNALPLVQYHTNEYWDLAPMGTAAGSVTVYYDGYQPTPISTNTANLRVAHQHNGQWLNEGRAAGSTGNNVSGLIVSNPVSTWSPFTFGAVSPVILPLQWLSFNGFLNSRQVATLT